MQTFRALSVFVALIITGSACGSDDGSESDNEGSTGGALTGGTGGALTGGTGGALTGGTGGAAGSSGSDGGAGVGGGAGSSSGDAGKPSAAYLLWTPASSSGSAACTARIWELDPSTGDKLAEQTLTLSATHGSGWAARDFDVLPDGTRRLLWTRATDGKSLIAVLDASNHVLSEIPNNGADPAASWFTTAYAKLPSGSGRLVWFNLAVGSAVVWPLGAGDQLDPLTKKMTYTPSADVGAWVPVSFAAAADGTTRLLWSFASNSGSVSGQHAVVWHFDLQGVKTKTASLSYKPDWYARSYFLAASGLVRMTWGNDQTGSGMVCTAASESALQNPTDATKPGWQPGQCRSYGPELGFVLRSITQ